jgi:hypothetical protein
MQALTAAMCGAALLAFGVAKAGELRDAQVAQASSAVIEQDAPILLRPAEKSIARAAVTRARAFRARR